MKQKYRHFEQILSVVVPEFLILTTFKAATVKLAQFYFLEDTPSSTGQLLKYFVNTS